MRVRLSGGGVFDFPRRYIERQMSDPSFGYVVADVVCDSCGSRSLAHGRRFPDSSLHLFVPEPEGGRTRRMLVGRKVRTGQPVDRTFIAFHLDEVPTDVPTVLRCPVHGVRSVDPQRILDAITTGKPTRPRVIRI